MMTKYRIIGNMTGNSMDAIDLVLTDFDGSRMTDICNHTKPYSKDMQTKVEDLRRRVQEKNCAEITSDPFFWKVHDEYIRQVAACIEAMCQDNQIDKSTITAIGFHGKTLDHNPPSKARRDGSEPYTLQIGSGQMLADLTGIPVVYDFRSDLLMAGFDGAPLAPLHNAHIAMIEGDGCYYNGGNTSNFSIVIDGKAIIAADAGPCNEYIDAYIRRHTTELYDRDGRIGRCGRPDMSLLQYMFDCGRHYYEAPLPKSGDPAYYHTEQIFAEIAARNIKLEDAVRSFEYFAAYIAVYALTNLPNDISLPSSFILFGGGWKNPLVKEALMDLLAENGYVLPEHQAAFHQLTASFKSAPQIRFSAFGDYMEARLFADMARYRLENKPWQLPETTAAGADIVCGRIAYPSAVSLVQYADAVNRAAKGWQSSFSQATPKKSVGSGNLPDGH